MKNDFETLLNKAGGDTSLTHEEKARMRHTLQAYMGMKPLRSPHTSRAVSFGWLFTMRPVAATLVLALFISSAGISYAAEDALPGDVLYPVKTNINEPIQGALAFSASAKTAWAMDVAGERVKEAATLAAEGRLDEATQQKLQADFEQHATLATENIAKTSDKESGAEAAVRFEAQLSEYGSVLAQIGGAKGVDTGVLASAVERARGAVEANRIKTESALASAGDADTLAATRIRIAARAQLDSSAKLALAVSKSLSTSSAELVAIQLENASSSIADGDTLAAGRSIPGAIGAFRTALSATEKIGVFLKTSAAIHTRTGLVIAEPQKEKVSSTARAFSKAAASESEQENRAPHPTAALMTFSAATPPQDSTPSTTATSTDDSHETATSTQEEERHDESVLPVSVPVHISF